MKGPASSPAFKALGKKKKEGRRIHNGFFFASRYITFKGGGGEGNWFFPSRVFCPAELVGKNGRREKRESAKCSVAVLRPWEERGGEKKGKVVCNATDITIACEKEKRGREKKSETRY